MFNRGDTVEHQIHGTGTVEHVWTDKNEYWVQFGDKLTPVKHEELKSRPDLRPNEEGRRWCRPPVGIHKPYRK